MKIEGRKRYLRRAVFAACLLEIYDFDLSIVEGSETYVQRLEDGKFLLVIEKGWPKAALMTPIAHEIAHVAQYVRGDLNDDEDGTIWKGEKHASHDLHTDGYYLSPWEMEARALEAWIEHKWETRVELH